MPVPVSDMFPDPRWRVDTIFEEGEVSGALRDSQVIPAPAVPATSGALSRALNWLPDFMTGGAQPPAAAPQSSGAQQPPADAPEGSALERVPSSQMRELGEASGSSSSGFMFRRVPSSEAKEASALGSGSGIHMFQRSAEVGGLTSDC